MIYLLILGALADDCSLLPDKEAQIPNPSLVKCYRQNTGACCVAAHDQTINEKYSELFPSPCLREYDTMENFFCFACEKTQGKYTNKTTKVLRLCEDYAKYVWGGDLNKPTSEYDNCGMYTF